ncbi:MAG TPA: ISKra4 family transposase [Candidatus Contendobacter sp.]|nr:ISKra4 family transposase [Candidatus Contendobacter sp.]
MTMMWPLPAQGKGLDVAACLAELTGVVEAAAREGLPAHVLEQSLWRQLLRLGHDLQAAYFALAGDGDCGATLQLADGRVVRRLPEQHPRPYQSIFGDFILERVVYGTREGQRIEAAPLDARLGLPEDRCSYLLRDWNQALVVENPYAQVDAVLERILGLKQSVASLETMTRTLAGAVAGYEATRPAPAPATGEQIVVLSADGKGVPLRKPADAPAIAAHDHARGPKPDRKKMAVLGAAYHIEPHPRTAEAVVESLFRDPAAPTPGRADRTAPRRPAPQHKRVCAVLPVAAAVAEALAPPRPADVIFPWLAEEARRRDPDHQHPWVLVMDGQPSLWDAAAATLGDAPRVEILDLLHATGYLWEAVHLFHDPGSDLALKWMKLLVLGLLSGMGTEVIRWLQHLAEQSELPAATRTRLEQIHGYFDRHRDRIHYDRYLAAGYPIASGVIEGACRHVVKDRMERAGMHWTLPGAQALLNLRCVALNDEWEPFMNHHIQSETARLYANIPIQPPSTRLRLVA